MDQACASHLRKTHNLTFQSKQLLYPWHRWYGLEVLTRKATGRFSDHVLWCRLPDDQPDVMLIAIPRWMFDSAICATMRLEARPVACCTALRAARELLRELSATASSKVLNPRRSQDGPGDADDNDTHDAISSPSTGPIVRVRGTPTPVGQSPAADPRRDRQESGTDSAQRSRRTPRQRRSKPRRAK